MDSQDIDVLYGLEASVQDQSLQLAKDVDTVCLTAEDGLPVDADMMDAVSGHITSIREALDAIEQAIEEILSS